MLVFTLKNPKLGFVDPYELPKFIEIFSKEKNYKIWIGTDSHAKNSSIIYATAIVVYRIGSGGTYFYYTTRESKYYDMYSRLIKEAEISLKTAEFVEKFLKLMKPEIHLDIGLNGKSKEVYYSITGYIKGLGYDYKTKPYSFAATNIAHLYTK